jgi:hypothetical protein
VVLTARYVELVLGDRRGLRLLLWQAPIVALFLLIGFQDKRYQDRIPFRHPTDAERSLLAALKNAQELAKSRKNLTDEQLEELKTYVFQLDPESRPQLQFDGRVLWAAVQLSGARTADSELRRRFERLTFSFPPTEVNDRGVTRTIDRITGAELVAFAEQPGKGDVLEKLLATGDPIIPSSRPYPSEQDDQRLVNPRQTYTLLFILVMVILWFGCNNAAKEIVKEEAIYARERSVNLGILPYLASKFLVLTAITTLHIVLLMGVLYGSLHLLAWLDPAGHSTPVGPQMLGYLAQFGVLVLLGMNGVALGLLLSAVVSTPDRANALLPYVLIPQMILGGGFLAVRGVLLSTLAYTLSPVYWAYRAVHLGSSLLPPSVPGATEHPDDLGLPCLVLTAQLLVMLAATAWCLKRKEA